MMQRDATWCSVLLIELGRIKVLDLWWHLCGGSLWREKLFLLHSRADLSFGIALQHDLGLHSQGHLTTQYVLARSLCLPA